MGSNKYGIVQYRETDNIGDDTITYSALQFVRNPDFIIDRENLNQFDSFGTPTKILNNGWFMHNPDRFYDLQKLKNVQLMLFSMHLNPNKNMNGVIDALKKLNCEVGCRDVISSEICQKNGIKNYLSGCSTLFLNQFKKNSTNNIYCVDVSDDLVNILKQKYRNFHIVSITQNRSKRLSAQMAQNRRFSEVQHLLQKYNDAACVVTTRLHTTLPCTALGTPVVLVLNHTPSETHRFNPYGNLVVRVNTEKDVLGIDLPNLKPHPIDFNFKYTKKINDFLDYGKYVCLFITNDPKTVAYTAYSLHRLYLTNKEFSPYIFVYGRLSDNDANLIKKANPNAIFGKDLQYYCDKFGIDDAFTHRIWPKFMWLKPLIGFFDEFNGRDQIIYADNDIDYLGSLNDLWNMDFHGRDVIGFTDYRKNDTTFFQKTIQTIDDVIRSNVNPSYSYLRDVGMRYINYGFFKVNLKNFRKKDPGTILQIGRKIHKLLPVNEQDYVNAQFDILSYNNDIYNTIDHNEDSIVRHYASSKRKIEYNKLVNKYMTQIGCPYRV